jgi:hypothetical protein
MEHNVAIGVRNAALIMLKLNATNNKPERRIIRFALEPVEIKTVPDCERDRRDVGCLRSN